MRRTRKLRGKEVGVGKTTVIVVDGIPFAGDTIDHEGDEVFTVEWVHQVMSLESNKTMRTLREGGGSPDLMR